MGTIRNRMLIVHGFRRKDLEKVRVSAVEYFTHIIAEELKDKIEYDVASEMISPILSSFINDEYSFVIMGDCSKNGWKISDAFIQAREKWCKIIGKMQDTYVSIYVADFGEGRDPFIEEKSF